mgnify:CR=1 FL=1
MAVVTEIVGAAPEDGDGGGGREFDGLGAVVGERDLHQLDLIVTGGDEVGNFSFETELGIFTGEFVPEQPCFEAGLLVFVEMLGELAG